MEIEFRYSIFQIVLIDKYSNPSTIFADQNLKNTQNDPINYMQENSERHLLLENNFQHELMNFEIMTMGQTIILHCYDRECVNVFTRE